MTDRNVNVAHTTILRWVQRYVPEFAKRWQRYEKPQPGHRLQVDVKFLERIRAPASVCTNSRRSTMARGFAC